MNRQLPPERKHDAERTKEDILSAAIAEFAELGLSGARVDAIAERTRTTKRMIYYYFGSKDGLYLAVLERVYMRLREIERGLDIGGFGPVEALRRLVEYTFDYQEAHPDFIRVINVENVHEGKFIARSSTIADVSSLAIDVLRDILERGERDGLFRSGIDPVDLHMLISSFCFFRVANRYTFGMIYRRDLFSSEMRSRHRGMVADVVTRWVSSGDMSAHRHGHDTIDASSCGTSSATS